MLGLDVIRIQAERFLVRLDRLFELFALEKRVAQVVDTILRQGTIVLDQGLFYLFLSLRVVLLAVVSIGHIEVGFGLFGRLMLGLLVSRHRRPIIFLMKCFVACVVKFFRRLTARGQSHCRRQDKGE
jgi:hypothetical protein